MYPRRALQGHGDAQQACSSSARQCAGSADLGVLECQHAPQTVTHAASGEPHQSVVLHSCRTTAVDGPSSLRSARKELLCVCPACTLWACCICRLPLSPLLSHPCAEGGAWAACTSHAQQKPLWRAHRSTLWRAHRSSRARHTSAFQLGWQGEGQQSLQGQAGVGQGAPYGTHWAFTATLTTLCLVHQASHVNSQGAAAPDGSACVQLCLP